MSDNTSRPARRARRPMHSEIWTHGTRPHAVRVAVDIYGDIAARLWSGGPDSGHFLHFEFTEGHHSKWDATPVGLFAIHGPIAEWRAFHELLTEALEVEAAEAEASAAGEPWEGPDRESEQEAER